MKCKRCGRDIRARRTLHQVFDGYCDDCCESGHGTPEDNSKFTEQEYDVLTHALTALCGSEPDRFEAANALHSKLIFNKHNYVRRMDDAYTEIDSNQS